MFRVNKHSQYIYILSSRFCWVFFNMPVFRILYSSPHVSMESQFIRNIEEHIYIYWIYLFKYVKYNGFHYALYDVIQEETYLFIICSCCRTERGLAECTTNKTYLIQTRRFSRGVSYNQSLSIFETPAAINLHHLQTSIQQFRIALLKCRS